MRTRLAIGAVAMLIMTGCASQTASSVMPSSVAPVVTEAPSTALSSAPASAPSAASALEGVWHTGVVTPDDAQATLQAAGLQQWTQPFLANSGFADSNVFTLRILGGRWVQYWSKNGGTDEDNDDGAYSISADTVTISHGSLGSDTYRWSVQGDTLTLTFLSDTFAPTDGIPEEVFQRAFYSAPFTRGPR